MENSPGGGRRWTAPRARNAPAGRPGRCGSGRFRVHLNLVLAPNVVGGAQHETLVIAQRLRRHLQEAGLLSGRETVVNMESEGEGCACGMTPRRQAGRPEPGCLRPTAARSARLPFRRVEPPPPKSRANRESDRCQSGGHHRWFSPTREIPPGSRVQITRRRPPGEGR